MRRKTQNLVLPSTLISDSTLRALFHDMWYCKQDALHENLPSMAYSASSALAAIMPELQYRQLEHTCHRVNPDMVTAADLLGPAYRL